MSLATCADCSAAYPGDLSACPQCRSTSRGIGSLLATVILCCRMRGCRYEGVPRRVVLRSAGPGVLEVPTYMCGGCGAELDWSREESDVPKIHEGRAPTYAPEVVAEDDSPDEVPAVSGPPAAEPEVSVTAPPDYSALTVEQLRGLLAERDLPKTGTKAELVARLQEADAETTGATGVTIVAEATVTRPDGSVA